ncbi:hypothetical protein V8D89_002779 [Ganoderma adspersum]
MSISYSSGEVDLAVRILFGDDIIAEYIHVSAAGQFPPAPSNSVSSSDRSPPHLDPPPRRHYGHLSPCPLFRHFESPYDPLHPVRTKYPALYWIWSLSNAFSLFSIVFRVFALSGKNRWQTVVVLIFGLPLPTAYLYLPAATTPILNSPFSGCGYNNDLTLSAYRASPMTHRCTRTLSVAADLLALAVTLRQTYKTFAWG